MRSKKSAMISRRRTRVESFEKKVSYIAKMISCLDSNIAAYNDFDLLEMEQAMLSALAEVESFNVDTSSAVAYVPGEDKRGTNQGINRRHRGNRHKRESQRECM